MADEKKHTRKHIVHKHTTKGFNERQEIEDILREKLEVGEIALNVGKDRPSLVFFAEHTPVSPHDADTNFDKMIELRPSPYVIHSASTDNVKPEIKEDHTLLDPYYVENFVTKLSDDYVEPVSAATLQPGTTLDEAVGQLVLSDKNINERIDEISGIEFATIDGVSVKSTTAFKSRMLNGHTALEDKESEYSGSDGCAEMWIGKIDDTPILTSNELGGTPEVNNFKFAKINGSAVTYVNEDAVDINVPMTEVLPGNNIVITNGESDIEKVISFAGLSANTINSSGHQQYVKSVRVNANNGAKLDVTYGDVDFYTKGETDNIVNSAKTEFNTVVNNFSGNVITELSNYQLLEERKEKVNNSNDEYPTSKAVIEYVTSAITDALTSSVSYKGATDQIPSGPSKTGDLWIASSEFAVNGKTAEIGDFIIYNGSAWDVIEKNNDGAVTSSDVLDANHIVIGNGARTVSASNLTLEDLAKATHHIELTDTESGNTITGITFGADADGNHTAEVKRKTFSIRATEVYSGTTSGNAITSMSASIDNDGYVITYAKTKMFSEEGHTHNSSDIVDAVDVWESNNEGKLLKAQAISASVMSDSVLTQNTLVVPAAANSRKIKSASVAASATTTPAGSSAVANVAVLGDNVVFGFDIPKGDKGDRGYSITALTAPVNPTSASGESNIYTGYTETGQVGTVKVWNGVKGEKGEDAEKISGLTLYNQAATNTGSNEVNVYKLWGEDGTDFGTIQVYNGGKGEKGENGKALTIKESSGACTVYNEHAFIYTGETQVGGFEQYHLYVLTSSGSTPELAYDDFTDVGLFAINGVGISEITATNNTGSSDVNVVSVTLTDGRIQQFNVYNGAQGQQGIQGIQGIQGVQGYSITALTAPATPSSASGESNIYTALTENGQVGTIEVWNGVQGVQGIQGVQGYSISAVERVNATFNTGSSQSNEYRVILNDGNSTQVGTFTIVNGAQGQQGIQGEPGKTLTIRPSQADCTEPDAHAFIYTGATTEEFIHNHLYLLTAIDDQMNKSFNDLGEFAIEGRGIASVTSAETSTSDRTGVEVTITLTDNTSSAFTVWNGTDAFTTDTKVTDVEDTAKAFLLGHATQGSNATAISNSNAYMSNGALYSQNKKVLVEGDVYTKTEIDDIVSGINVTIEEDEYVTSQALNDLNDRLIVVNGQFDNYQLLSERGTVINNTSTDNEYPTSKAVYNYVTAAISGFETEDTKVKTATATTKAYIVGKTESSSTASGVTNENVFMSGGTIYINGKEVATQEYVDNAPDSDEKVAHKSSTTETAYLFGVSSTGASNTITSGITSGVYMKDNGLYASHGFYQSSDETLKDFGEDVKIDFDELVNIPKKYFTWKEKADSTQHIGTSAQELQKVYPELVRTDATGKLTVDYASLSVIALAAVDKLHKENDELKKRIESIERYLTEKNK